MTMCIAIFLLDMTTVYSYANWTEGSTTMPRANNHMCVGYSSTTDTIWLAGGPSTPQSLMSFNVASEMFTDHGSTALSLRGRAYSSAQSYAQLDEYLYYVDYGTTVDFLNLLRFNLSTGSEDLLFESSLAGGAQAYAQSSMCIIATSSGPGTIYVIGGTTGINSVDYLKTAWVLDLGTAMWSQTCDMQDTRAYSGCAANGEETELFVAGGYNGPTKFDSVEVMDVQTMQWRTLNDTLSQVLFYPKVIRADNARNLLVVGGWTGVPNAVAVSTVHIIDWATYSITVSAGSLDIPVYGDAVVANKVAYVFGGYSTAKLNTWRSLHFPFSIYPMAC